MRSVSLGLGLATALIASNARADNTEGGSAADGLTVWTIDAAHAHVGFSVPHLVVSEVEGKFHRFSGNVLLDEKHLERSRLDFTVEVASIDTGEPKRDEHLRSGDFFDAAAHPQILFKSTRITRAGKGYKIRGELTMRGVTKPVTLDATLSEPIKSPFGTWVRAARLSGKVNRQDFGIRWNKTLDQGGLAVGDIVTLDVKLEIDKPVG